MTEYTICAHGMNLEFRFPLQSAVTDTSGRFEQHATFSGLLCPRLKATTPLVYELSLPEDMIPLDRYAAIYPGNTTHLLSIMSSVMKLIQDLKDRCIETATLVLDPRYIYLNSAKRLYLIYLPVSRGQRVEDALGTLYRGLKSIMEIGPCEPLDKAIARDQVTVKQLLSLHRGIDKKQPVEKAEKVHANRALFENMDSIEALDVSKGNRDVIRRRKDKIVLQEPEWVKPASIGIGIGSVVLGLLMDASLAGLVTTAGIEIGFVSYWSFRRWYKKQYVQANGDLRNLKAKEQTLGLRVIYPSGQTGELIGIDFSPFTVGRMADNRFIINDPQVSGHHAVIVHIEKDYLISDLHSVNHTFVNDKVVLPNTRVKISPGDRIRFATQEYMTDVWEKEAPLTIQER